MNTPAVSIIVAVKDSARFLAQALDSIAAQHCDEYEVLVVDGGSTDDSLAIARRYEHVRCLQQSGRGFTNAWNSGIEASAAEFIAFLDSDDYWAPDKLAPQLALLRAHPDAAYAFGRVRFFLEPGCALPAGFRPDILEGSHAVPSCGAMLVRRSAIDRVGLLDEGLRIASDIAWLARLRDCGASAALDRVLLHKRLHAANLGHATDPALFRSELLEVARQRIAQGKA
jgi:glycosyltransferase involved in cell wall biosynthesis